MLRFRDSVMAYKCANSLAPDYLCIKFKKRSSVHDRATRNNNKFHIPLYRTFSGQRTFAYRALSLWNSLDEGFTIVHFSQGLQMFSENQHAE